MAHQFTGYSPSNRGIISNCVDQAAAAVDKGHKQLISLQRTKSGEAFDNYTRWFGQISDARLKRVTEVVALMDFGLNSGRMHFTYNEGCAANTNAAAFAPDFNGKAAWRVSELKETLASGRYKITLCPRFFGALPQDAQDQQSRTGTFIHELSHAVGNTDDEQYNGVTCYGREWARILADRSADQAINNAENYGFYGTWLLRKPGHPEPDFAGLGTLFGS